MKPARKKFVVGREVIGIWLRPGQSREARDRLVLHKLRIAKRHGKRLPDMAEAAP